MWYKKIMRAVIRNIDNLAELERLEKQKRQVQVPVTELSSMPAASGVGMEVNQSTLGVSDDLNWDAILAAFSVSVGENFSKGVRRLLGG